MTALLIRSCDIMFIPRPFPSVIVHLFAHPPGMGCDQTIHLLCSSERASKRRERAAHARDAHRAQREPYAVNTCVKCAPAGG